MWERIRLDAIARFEGGDTNQEVAAAMRVSQRSVGRFDGPIEIEVPGGGGADGVDEVDLRIPGSTNHPPPRRQARLTFRPGHFHRLATCSRMNSSRLRPGRGGDAERARHSMHAASTAAPLGDTASPKRATTTPTATSHQPCIREIMHDKTEMQFYIALTCRFDNNGLSWSLNLGQKLQLQATCRAAGGPTWARLRR